MCQTPGRRKKELRPSPPSMATARPDQALLPSSSGTTGSPSAPSQQHSAGSELQTRLEGCRAAAKERSSMEMHITLLRTPIHTAHAHTPFYVWVFPLFLFSKAKSPRGAWRTAGCFPSPLRALSNDPLWCQQGWIALHLLLPWGRSTSSGRKAPISQTMVPSMLAPLPRTGAVPCPNQSHRALLIRHETPGC